MRHNEATRVTSMMYLPPVFAVIAEMALFGVVPSALAAWRGPRAASLPGVAAAAD